MKTWPKKKKKEIVFLLALILAMKSAIKILDPIRFIMDAHIDVIFISGHHIDCFNICMPLFSSFANFN